MVSEWITMQIGDIGRIVTGKTPSTKDPTNFNGPFPFITIPDLDGSVYIKKSERSLSEKAAQKMHSCLLPPGSVMMSCIATVGKCGITTRPSFTNQQINSVIPRDGIDSRFLYYVFTQIGNELEAAGGGGSVYTNVSKSRFANIPISFPRDLAEQRAIAHILGMLDDKIELNRRMSETLEQMARALFKAWFVDFEPVRARWRAAGGAANPCRACPPTSTISSPTAWWTPNSARSRRGGESRQ
ncbi:restriction endonuclease subunit S [Anaerolinea sp.]|uniref:restriction endonuclease subunit S n=1 Tax=Anaerolinea sp. TaxID=1872519 RepID=UPI002ACE622D|nr:restriction endonuclease subunit S [Anaerolinea sp.]